MSEFHSPKGLRAVPYSRTVLLSSLCVLALSGCATLESAQAAVPSVAPPASPPPMESVAPPVAPVAPAAALPRRPLTPQMVSRVQLHIMAGEMAAGRQQPDVAAAEFLEALELIDDGELAQRATVMAAAARDEELARRAAHRWLELEPNSGEAREVIARVALRQNDMETLRSQSRELIKGHPAGVGEGFRQVALFLAQAGGDRQEQALTMLNDLVMEWPEAAGAHHAMSLLALRFGQLTLAEQAAAHATQLAPQEREHALLLVAIYLQQGRLADADSAAEKLMADDPDAAELRVGYARLLLEAGQRAAARQQLERALAARADLVDARYALGVLSFGERDFAAATRYFTPLLTSPRAQDAAFELGRIAEAQSQDKQALEHYNRVTRGPQALDAAVRRAFIMSRNGELSEARDLLESLREQLPQLAQRFFLAEGELLVTEKQLETARKLYDDALTEFPEDNDLTYARSLIHEQQNRIDLAEKDLRALIQRDPEDVRALNALGYLLTEHTRRFDEAHELIGRALQLEPNDPAIIDSMGWVQFKRGEVQDARNWLERAFARFPDPEVAAHLGEVLWTLGEQDEARKVWNSALSDDPEHPVLKETMRRLLTE